jgi:putative inorganic carbon (HCO3(-)) transporter
MNQTELAVEEFKGLDRYDRRIDISLLIGIFLLPLFSALAGVFLFAAFIFWVMKLRLLKKGGGSFGLTLEALDIIQLILWGVGWISVILSTNAILSFQGIILFSAYFLTYFLVVNNISTRKRLDLVLNALLFSFVLVSAFGVFQFFVNTPITYKLNRFIMVNLAKMDGRRLVSTMYSANIFGEYLAFIIALLVGLFMTDESSVGRVKKGLLGGLGLFCLVFSYSRGAYIGFAISVLSLIPFIRRKRLFVGLFIAAAVVFVLISPPSVKDRLKEIIDLEQTFSKERLQSYQSAFAIVGDYPFTGTGIYTTDVVYRKYAMHYLGQRSFDYIHNIYFEVAVEMGLMSITALVLTLVVALKECWNGVLRATDNRLRGLMVGFWMGFVGFAVHQMFDAGLYVGQMGLFFWLMLGLMASVSRIASSEREHLKGHREVKVALI